MIETKTGRRRSYRRQPEAFRPKNEIKREQNTMRSGTSKRKPTPTSPNKYRSDLTQSGEAQP